MIKLLIMDVDGTLTDGKIYMSNNGEIMKAFSIKDGYMISHLKDYEIIPVILTGRTSKIVQNRAEELQIHQIYQGISNKADFLTKIMEDNKVCKENVAYIGDDDNDIECMKKCGLVGCPKDASIGVISIADFISPNRGGNGAVRDFIEYIYKVNGVLE
ncbi:MAG: KdsC family phosphatase [Thomasclavelia ramosa]